MGKAKTSRKGKREWRKNISSNEFEQLAERIGRADRSGAGSIEAASNDSLFFVDKSGDENLQKKIHKHRNKVLHCDSVLQRSSLVPALPAAKKRKHDRDAAKREQKLMKLAERKNAPQETKTNAVDLWGDNNHGKSTKKPKNALPEVPAVEVDVPGCSYNPTFEDHQEALGAAVAQEMQLIYQKELQPEPLPLAATASLMDDEEEFFLDVDQSDDEEEAEPETEINRAVKVKKLTRADLNKRARKLEVRKQEAEQLKKKKLNQEIDSIPEIEETIQEEDDERKKLWLRRMACRKDRRASNPPRLGKHKFKPDTVKVLLSEEVTGSMRKLKGCYLLLRERYKSLQRRGIIEPRIPVGRKARKMWVTYEPGTKGLKERQMQAEREARKQALAVVPL